MVISTTSPSFLLINCWPIGDSLLILPSRGLASTAPTKVYLTSLEFSRFFSLIVLPRLTLSFSPSPIITAFCKIFSISAIRVSANPCFFLAASYSLFSRKSPKSRAVATSSAIYLRWEIREANSSSSSFFPTLVILNTCFIFILF